MSFATFILYLVCVFIRPQDWVPGLEGAPLINILGIATIVFLMFETAGKSSDRQFVKAPQSWLIIGMLFSIIMSHVAHHYFGGLQDSFIRFYPTVILFFVILNAINTRQRLKVAMGAIVFMMCVLVFQGMYQAKTGIGWGGQEITLQINENNEDDVIRRVNWVGVFNDPNDLAFIFVIAIGFLLPFIFDKISILVRLLNVAIVCFLGYGIFLTNSRGGMLALGGAVFIFFIRKTKNFILGGVLGGLGAALMIIFGPSRMSMLSSSEDSASSRIDLWYGGIQMFKANPVFGVGQGLFMDDMPQTAHNSYVLAASELGFVGLFFWVALIYTSMKGLVMVQEHNKRLYNYALGIQSALTGFCTAAFFLSRTYVIVPYMLFAMAGSVAWLAWIEDKSISIKFGGNDVRNVFLLCVAILIAVILLIRGR